jgi:two-component system nitrogen regulation sensor histidine kinase NtrY
MTITESKVELSWPVHLLRWLRNAPKSNIFSVGVGVLALLSSIATYLALQGIAPFPPGVATITILLVINLILVLTLLSLIVWRIVSLGIARRRGSAGARLHVRFVKLFSLIAIMPAILVAVFAIVTLNTGFEAWFNERTRTIIVNAHNVAQAYLTEHGETLRADALAMATDVNRAASAITSAHERFEEFMTTQAALRALPGALIVDSKGQTLARAHTNIPMKFEIPTVEEFERARQGEVLLAVNERGDHVQALLRLNEMKDGFLLITRFVDPQVLDHLRRSRAAMEDYDRLEGRRYTVQLTFALIYIVVAVLLLLAAIWFGLWLANRMVQPIGRLITAAERVSDGDLSARVHVANSDDDELGSLARAFNRMTSQIENQRNELVEANRQIDGRRRFTETVLAGVSAGVIGLDRAGQINHVNRSALQVLGRSLDELIGVSAIDAIPEIATLVRSALAAPQRMMQGQVKILRDNVERNLNVRVTGELTEDASGGFVVTIDDITDLLAAQRASAWAGIARRIAHEIKNPLTPIQLSAERLRRKYTKEIISDPEIFEQCTNTIIRQVNDIGRMVNEFSAFARMPAPEFGAHDLLPILRETVFLERVGTPEVEFVLLLPEAPVCLECDPRLVRQALINILKNAVEAVAARINEGQTAAAYRGQVKLRLEAEEDQLRIEIIDNGAGLPVEDRQNLTEPYVTTRPKGSGIGLAVVKKVMEDHGGILELEDSPEGRGALVRLVFPRHIDRKSKSADHESGQENRNGGDGETDGASARQRLRSGE